MATIPQTYDPNVPLGDLHPDPANPNEGDAGGIAAAITEIGFYGAVLARTDGTIIAGEHRWRAAAMADEATVPVLYLDVDATRARQILLGDNRWARRGRDDPARLAELLEALVAEEGPEVLEPTGYDGDDLDQLLADLTADEQRGDDDRPQRDGNTVTVHFRDEDAAATFFEMIGARPARSFWWPDAAA